MFLQNRFRYLRGRAHLRCWRARYTRDGSVAPAVDEAAATAADDSHAAAMARQRRRAAAVAPTTGGCAPAEEAPAAAAARRASPQRDGAAPRSRPASADARHAGTTSAAPGGGPRESAMPAADGESIRPSGSARPPLRAKELSPPAAAPASLDGALSKATSDATPRTPGGTAVHEWQDMPLGNGDGAWTRGLLMEPSDDEPSEADTEGDAGGGGYFC